MDQKDRMRVKSFKLGGHTIKVKYLKTVRDPDSGAEIFGLCNPMTNEIHIALSVNKHLLSEDVIKHSAAHERAHYMMILMNEGELNKNEQFIDMLGMFMHQYDETKK